MDRGLSAQTIPALASTKRAVSNPAIRFMAFSPSVFLDLSCDAGSVSYPCYSIVTMDSASVDTKPFRIRHKVSFISHIRDSIPPHGGDDNKKGNPSCGLPFFR